VLLVDAFYTGCLWVAAISFASLGVFVWAIPTLFKQFSNPDQRPMRRRQTFYSAVSFAAAAFCVFYVFTQFPNLNRPAAQVVAVGLNSFALGMAAIRGWTRLVIQIVSQARLRSRADTAGPSWN
jgi:hypothetical protein